MTASRRDGPASQEVSSAPTRLSVAALAKRRLAATLTDLAALGPHLSKKKGTQCIRNVTLTAAAGALASPRGGSWERRARISVLMQYTRLARQACACSPQMLNYEGGSERHPPAAPRWFTVCRSPNSSQQTQPALSNHAIAPESEESAAFLRPLPVFGRKEKMFDAE